jgi:hypothetical protein
LSGVGCSSHRHPPVSSRQACQAGVCLLSCGVCTINAVLQPGLSSKPGGPCECFQYHSPTIFLPSTRTPTPAWHLGPLLTTKQASTLAPSTLWKLSCNYLDHITPVQLAVRHSGPCGLSCPPPARHLARHLHSFQPTSWMASASLSAPSTCLAALMPCSDALQRPPGLPTPHAHPAAARWGLRCPCPCAAALAHRCPCTPAPLCAALLHRIPAGACCSQAAGLNAPLMASAEAPLAHTDVVLHTLARSTERELRSTCTALCP